MTGGVAMSLYASRTCRYGTMLFNSNDEFVGRSLLLYGEWSEPESALFAQMIREGDTVVEAGANIGSHTVMLSKAVGDSGTVYAFEPQRHTFQLLSANLALNERLNVRASQYAVGDADETVEFPVVDPRLPNNFGGSSLLMRASVTEPVLLRAIDSLRLPRLDFLKADVEGFEAQVIRGAQETIRAHRPIVYLEYMNHYTGDSSKSFLEFFASLGYRVWYFITPLFNRLNFRGNPENVFEGMWSFDLICVPGERGEMQGLVEVSPDNEGVCHDPDAWRRVRFVPA
ncbi:tRNA(1-methyladenosine) methyltransferase and related methyltransferases,methyltransferase, FkbM family [Burkholderia stabilis]|uniref:tRNA(1-methyladenosine) methyltransferase and related methyltransferases,methyltransferase, FkbM family n=2 Tax=Burkholderia stabilis TaxID=95485 RepID=A0AAJ5T8D9_9BURK|nr:tRNA(1-methyladenosine) methyltransferase and related methyltransferases,methyltransferase, FkbM family [Burkholderia stabilis]